MLAGPAIKEWYTTYTQFLSSDSILAQSVQTPGLSAAVENIAPPMQDNMDLLSNMPIDWEGFLAFNDSAADYGLGQLFAEPISLQTQQSTMTGMLPASYASNK